MSATTNYIYKLKYIFSFYLLLIKQIVFICSIGCATHALI